MTQNNVFRWLDGRGWLVLSGGAESGGEVRAQVISRSSADGGVAYISLGEAAERVLDDMEDLGAPSGYIVDVLSEDDETVQARLSEAGIIVVEAADSLMVARSALLGAAVDGMKAAFQNGAIILVEGLSASVFAEWVVLDDGKVVAGLEWLSGAAVLPGVTAVSQSAQARGLLDDQTSAVAVGIGAGSALALGPNGEVETWGQKQITVVLGRDYTT